MIKLENIKKVYKMGDNEVRALDGVSIHIRPHEYVAVIGPSGSGKSTLMNMIGCLDTPTSGKFWIDGVEVSKMRDNDLADLRNKKLGFIFQQYNLLPKLSAIENVELPLIYKGLPAAKRHELAMEALKKVGLEDKIHHKPTELSGGQQQRVSIARALSSHPSLILADEPTGALDSKSGVEIMHMLHDLYMEGNTIIIITHDLNIAKQAARIITIKDGKIVSDIDNSNDMAGADNVKASDINDVISDKVADLDANIHMQDSKATEETASPEKNNKTENVQKQDIPVQENNHSEEVVEILAESEKIKLDKEVVKTIDLQKEKTNTANNTVIEKDNSAGGVV